MNDAQDIVGQEAAWDVLSRAVADGRVPHAWLFHGPRGVGKAAVARRFARLLLCDRPGAGAPCGRCPPCTTAAPPDFDVFAPPEGARNLSIEAIRELTRRAALSPSHGARRVFLVDDAHAMTEEAANALLKTLEEPPAGTVLLLVTFRPDALLPTVLSRTRALAFQPLPPGACARLLAERHGVDPADAREASALSLGSPGQALELMATAAWRERAAIVRDLREADATTLFEAAERLLALARGSAAGETLESLRAGVRVVFQLAGAWLRDVAVLGAGADASLALHGVLAAEAADAARAGGGFAREALDRLAEAREALDRNVNPALTVEWWLSALAGARDGRSAPRDRRGEVSWT